MTHKLHMFAAVCCLGLASLTTAVAQIDGSPSLQVPVKVQSIPTISKSNVSDDLLALEKDYKTASGRQRSGKVGFQANNILLQVYGNKVIIDVVAKEGEAETLVAALQEKGMEVTGTFGRVISGFMPISSLGSLQAVTGLQYAAPAYKPTTNVGVITSQGDVAMRANIAKTTFKVDGLGVKIGILSDTYNSLGGAPAGVTNGDLPGPGNPNNHLKPVQVLSDLPNGSDEGRAMAELIHDVAPGAELAYHTAFSGQAGFAQGIVKLADAGCKVIVDDVIYFAEPFFQDGIIAQAVDQVKERGVSYFSAAGNSGRASYESDYRPTGDNPIDATLGIAHNFAAYASPATYFQPVFIPQGGQMILSFQWDNPFFSASGVKSQTDMDIYLIDVDGNIVAAGANDNIASGDPVEVFGYENDTESETFFVMITNYAGPNPRRLKYLNFGDGAFYNTTPPIPGILSSTLVGHANAAGAVAVGATAFFNSPAFGLNPPVVNGFSSLGGCPIFFDKAGNSVGYVVRSKPEIVATDGANTSFFGNDVTQDADTLPNFFGTSAAAPHAAAVAALMIEASKSPSGMSPDYVKGTLAYTAIDMDHPNITGFQTGFDYRTGFGHVDAEKAVATVAVIPNYVTNLGLMAMCSAAPDTSRNWKITNPNPFNVRVMWEIFGTTQKGELIALPGETMLSTMTVAGMNTLVLSWSNASGMVVKNTQASSGASCTSAARGTIAAAQTSQDFNILSAYPNPTSGKISILYTNGEAKNLQVRLFNINGQQLYNRLHINQINNSEISVDASALPAGLYLLKVKQGQSEKTVKVVKQ